MTYSGPGTYSTSSMTTTTIGADGRKVTESVVSENGRRTTRKYVNDVQVHEDVQAIDDRGNVNTTPLLEGSARQARDRQARSNDGDEPRSNVRERSRRNDDDDRNRRRRTIPVTIVKNDDNEQHDKS